MSDPLRSSWLDPVRNIVDGLHLTVKIGSLMSLVGENQGLMVGASIAKSVTRMVRIHLARLALPIRHEPDSVKGPLRVECPQEKLLSGGYSTNTKTRETGESCTGPFCL